jgi:hypothetical protein
MVGFHHDRYTCPLRILLTVLILLILSVSLTPYAFPVAAVGDLDFGDAPEPYPTLLVNNGAFHFQSLPIYFGTSVDPEPDGLPEPAALGDDKLNLDDEDGVQFTTPIVPGQTMSVTVDSFNGTAVLAFISAWVDFNCDGDWADPGEQILTDVPAPPVPSSQSLDIKVPEEALPGPSYARFRISSHPGLPYEGPAEDGEVEDYLVEIEESELDWGDAPDPPYCTLAAKNGACHLIDPTTYLGWSIDAEADGQPSAAADGDDVLDGNDDEDGVAFVTQLVPGMPAQVDVTFTFGSSTYVGYLAIWADFDGNGSFSDPGDIFLPETVVGPGLLGTHTFSFFASVPASAVTGSTYVRVRFCDTPTVPCDGFYWYGEVEDYEVTLEGLDWGDAPDPSYPTLAANNGACHNIVPGMYLGATVDNDSDGQPNATATGDDLDASIDDEDGVVFTSPILPGVLATLDVTASAGGCLDAWVDFNDDGDWADAGEQVFASEPLVGGSNGLKFVVPVGAAAGQSTFARFRYSSTGSLSYVGLAGNGEVEDYLVEIGELDWGDAPDPSYPTLAASNGACHNIVPGFCLGAIIDTESDGQPYVGAAGDDIATSDDEDGVVFTTPLIIGPCSVDVTVTGNGGYVNAWIDFNRDGDWNDPGEHCLASIGPLPGGTHTLLFNTPSATTGPTYARFRLSTVNTTTPEGLAPDGEVEDYIVMLQPDGEEFDFGDAPDPTYPTLSASNGACHVLSSLYLGATVDPETDGQQESSGFFYSVGDDWAGTDDEDGVVFLNEAFIGDLLQTEVTVTSSGYLDVWADFDRDGQWATGEHFIDSLLLGAGTHPVSFVAPPTAAPGGTYVRFRISDQTTTECDGYGGPGEVEDYLIVLKNGPSDSTDWGDAPSSYRTDGEGDGAYHCDTYGEWMGNLWDSELTGTPSDGADSDDFGGSDDEDGISFDTSLIPGQNATITCSLVVNRTQLDAWIDFNSDGDWADAGEQIFVSRAMLFGANSLMFPVPVNAVPGATYARFRSSPAGNLKSYRYACGGEVEDYMVSIVDLDWGDAPDPSYPTLAANNGASHIVVPGMYLGTAIDKDSDGQPDASATGDDLDTDGDDEDGVVFATPLVPWYQAELNVTASLPGYLDAWVDFNDDGDWADAGEKVFHSQPLVAGIQRLSFTVPNDADIIDFTFARFRYSSTGGLSYTGGADDGEVEDYKVDAPVSVDIDLQTGWNMVSVPLFLPPDGDDLIDVFPSAVAVYTWDPTLKSYIVPDYIDFKRAYWVAVISNETVTLRGAPITGWNDWLTTGWNMVGSVCGNPVAVGALIDDPSGSILDSAIYCWNPTGKCYDCSSHIHEGMGHWVATTQNCSLTMCAPV